MEVAPSGPQILSEPLRRRGTPLPLSQLVEESRNTASIPNQLLDSKIYVKLKSNSQIQAEPPELHFSGFEIEKSYIKTLKLINISSEVMNIHIIPTQTKYFRTTYTKKCRLVPGLAYALKVAFCPDEWRYFYDCIHVHCKDEENLLIPVHAYPVIDDLHIPPRVDLPAVPLGQSIFHSIPLRCSCPVDFKFQVFVLQPHEAFSIHPLKGVIPARGETKIAVTFSPQTYETSQLTFQLVISQFNTKPYLCTVTGSSAPHLTLSQLKGKPDSRDAEAAAHKGPSDVAKLPPRRKSRQSSTKESDRLKTQRDQDDVKHGPTPSVDVCTPAGVAKMLIKDINKLSSKDLKQALSCGSGAGKQSRQMKEALFIKKVQQAEREEQTNHLKWQVRLGLDPMSERTLLQIMAEREMALQEGTVKREDAKRDEDFPAGQTKLSSTRVLLDTDQIIEGTPSFQFYTCIQWELKQRALRLFQQAARKVVIRCRMNRRLTSLKKLRGRMKSPASPQKDEENERSVLKISPDKVFPFSFPIFSEEEEPFAPRNLEPVPVDPIDVTVTTHIPFFKLQVPQHYKLMGYQPVSAWEAFNDYIPATLARPLRTGAPDALEPVEVGAESPRTAGEEEQREDEEKHVASKETAGFSFRAPEALLRPFPANRLRIFNPAPGLQAYKTKPKYLESDVEFPLCPLPRYAASKSSVGDLRTQTPNAHKFLDCEEVIRGVMKWENLDSNQLTGDTAPHRSVDYDIEILPLTAPPPLATFSDDLPPLTEKPCGRVQLTPEMIKAEFLSRQALVSNSNLTAGTTGRERQLEATHRSEVSRMGKRATNRLKQLEASDRASPSPEENKE